MHTHIDLMIGEYERGRLTRRQLVVRLAAVASGLAAAATAVAAQERPGSAAPPTRPADPPREPTFKATELNHVALRVADLARSQAFYEKHLGLTVTSAGATTAFLDCGPHFLALFAERGEPGLDHFCFTVPRYEPADAVRRLEAAGLEATRRGDRVYFKDADGIELQVAASNRREGQR